MMRIIGKKLIQWALWLVVFFAIIFVVDYYRTQQIIKSWPILTSLQAINGNAVDVAKLSQQERVMVYIWATWCGPCKVVSPSVNWFAKHFSVVTIALDSGANEDVRAYLEKNDLAFTTINDQNQSLGRALGVPATPTVLVVDKGKVVSATMGVSTPIGLWLRMVL